MILTDELLDEMFGKPTHGVWHVLPGQWIKSNAPHGYTMSSIERFTTVAEMIAIVARNASRDAINTYNHVARQRLWDAFEVDAIIEKIADRVTDKIANHQS